MSRRLICTLSQYIRHTGTDAMLSTVPPTMVDVQWASERVNETRTTYQFERIAENRFNNLAEQDVNMRTTRYIVIRFFFLVLRLVSLFECRLKVSALTHFHSKHMMDYRFRIVAAILTVL